VTDGYRASMSFGRRRRDVEPVVHDAVVVVEGAATLAPGARGTVRAWVVSPDELPRSLAPEAVFTLLEGDRIVGRAELLEVLADPTPQPLADLRAAKRRRLVAAEMLETPLADAVEAFLATDGTSFSLPGHKRALDDPLLALDVALVPGADDAQMSGDVLGRAERLAASLWRAEHCRFSVAGSTMANQALALAVGSPGDRVAVSRTLHRSLFSGLILSGLEPVWMQAEIDPRAGLTVGVPVHEVAAALEQDVRAVFLVEPSYTGVLSDVPAIAELAHEAGVPLVVDQAWGAHLGLGAPMPPNAMQCGADAMVVSVHKTLTSFTQAALCLASGERLDLRRFDAAFDALHTTSPSAAIQASIDRTRRLMATEGPRLLAAAARLATRFRGEIGALDGVVVLDEGVVERFAAAAAVDPLKLVVSLAGTGADGFAVERDLLRAGIRLEMADRDTLVPILTVADDEEAVERLIDSLRASIEARRSEPRPVAASAAWRVRPQTAMSPREAFFSRSELVPADEAVGRVCAELAAPYPPGIPALAPGEIVTEGIVSALQAEADAGTRLAYCADPSLRRVLVVAA
jgi:arginine decarboxylase